MAAQPFGRIGVIGDPVAHSLSPVFQQAAFDALNIPVRYELLHTPADQLDDRVRELREGIFSGANVTVPHKEFFFSAVDELSDVATRVGAVNTIIYGKDGRLFGDNTDVHGFAASLHDDGFPFGESDAIVLGAGGASRGVVVALLDNGIRSVTVANRTFQRAERLIADLGDPRLAACDIESALDRARKARLLVNATSVGWGDARLPVDPAIFSVVDAEAIAYDLTYRDTPFLQEAARRRLQTIDGLSMLVHQGARSFELWTGQTAPLDVMFASARNARG